MSEDNKGSTVLKRAREVRFQMDYLIDLLEGDPSPPDRGCIEQAREVVVGMTRLVEAMEEGR